MQIMGSVGRNGVNNDADVRIVQTLLQNRRYYTGRIDGICGPGTIRAIEAVQKTFMLLPDGRVDPNGTTLRRLTSPVTPVTAATTPALGLISLVQKPAKSSINAGLRSPSNKYMASTFGNPRDSYSQKCQPVTNPTLKVHMRTDSVGPFRVTGYARAVESLAAVMEDIRRECPDVYPYLGSAGMLCCRHQRKRTDAISNHSWGTAIDLTLKGELDNPGDNLVQYGLTLIAPIFHRHQWYWGAAFGTEDAMHFEVSQNLIEKWAR